MGTPRTLSRLGGSLPNTRTISNICSATYSDSNIRFSLIKLSILSLTFGVTTGQCYKTFCP
jgi:hypothetical protein